MIVIGKAFKYGDNVDTDVIIPARYLNSSDPEHLKQHCMEDIDPDFASSVSDGDILVAGQLHTFVQKNQFIFLHRDVPPMFV